jgi:trk system potassium uptake protein TrkA
MRIVFVGAGEYTAMTADALIDSGHEVIVVEKDKSRIEELSQQLDCSFLHGDGSKPNLLKEADPERTDILFCLAASDQDNLIASLVGRSLGFSRVVTSIQDPDLEGICQELGLRDTIIPGRTISRYLTDLVRGIDVLELSTAIKADARFFMFTVTGGGPRTVEDLRLPDQARVVCYYRKGDFALPDENTDFREGDEIVLVAHSRHLPELEERWKPKQAQETGEDEDAGDANGED